MKNNQLHSYTHCINCIIPPHMVESIKLRGNEAQRKIAAVIESQATRYRDERETATFNAVPQAALVPTNVINLQPDREVYDGQKKARLPGKLVRSEGQGPVTDPVVNEVYDGAGAVYDLYAKQYGRDSLDGQGLKLIQTVHHRRNYDNAFWNGEQMAYGDGGSIFASLTELTIIGHEFSHGVVQFSGGLVYRDQSGALNESFADVFGCLTEQYLLR